MHMKHQKRQILLETLKSHFKFVLILRLPIQLPQENQT